MYITPKGRGARCAHRDEADPEDRDPGDDDSKGAQRERTRLKVLFVDQADEDGDCVCAPATPNSASLTMCLWVSSKVRHP